MVQREQSSWVMEIYAKDICYLISNKLQYTVSFSTFKSRIAYNFV